MNFDIDLLIIVPLCLASHIENTILINGINEFDFLTACLTLRHPIDSELCNLVVIFNFIGVSLQDSNIKEILVILCGLVLLGHGQRYFRVLGNDWFDYDLPILLNISAKIKRNNICELHLTEACIFGQHSRIDSSSLAHSLIWFYLLVELLSIEKFF